MNEISSILFYIIDILVCFGIPIISFMYLVATRKDAVKSFFVGVFIFLIFQVFTRIPLLQYVLPKMDWYSVMEAVNPIMYCLFLGLTAGLFEELGRFVGFKVALKRNLKWIDGVAFGIGHGGIEAILLVGIPSIQRLIVSLANGTFDSAKMGISGESVKSSFVLSTNIIMLAGCLERIFAIICHVGLSLIILYGIKKRKLIYLGLAILIHTVIDSSIVILPKALGIGIIGTEIFIAIQALMFFIYIIKFKSKFEKLEGVDFNG